MYVEVREKYARSTYMSHCTMYVEVHKKSFSRNLLETINCVMYSFIHGPHYAQVSAFLNNFSNSEVDASEFTYWRNVPRYYTQYSDTCDRNKYSISLAFVPMYPHWMM